jgi:hypothetical protein
MTSRTGSCRCYGCVGARPFVHPNQRAFNQDLPRYRVGLAFAFTEFSNGMFVAAERDTTPTRAASRGFQNFQPEFDFRSLYHRVGSAEKSAELPLEIAGNGRNSA